MTLCGGISRETLPVLHPFFALAEKKCLQKKKNWQKSLIKAIKGNENQTALSRAKMDDEQSQDGWCAATSCNIWVPTGLPNTEIAHCTLNNCTTLCAAAANVTRG